MKNKAKFIKVNDTFGFWWDVYSWCLVEKYIGKDRDGNPKEQTRETWHNNINQVCEFILNKSIKNAESLEEIIDKTNKAKKEIKTWVDDMLKTPNEIPRKPVVRY